MKLYITLLFTLLLTLNLKAQESKAIEVGEWVMIGACPKGQVHFNFIDEYARVQPLDTNSFNKQSGEGLLNAFFNDKSMDAHRLPCLHTGKKYQIAALHVFEEEEKGKKVEKRIMLLYSGYPLTLFWVQIDEAIEAGEISF